MVSPHNPEALQAPLAASKLVLMRGIVLPWCGALWFSLLQFMRFVLAHSSSFSRSQCVKHSFLVSKIGLVSIEKVGTICLFYMRMSQPGNQSLSKLFFSVRKKGMVINRNSIRFSVL